MLYRITACIAVAGVLAACESDVAEPDAARPQFVNTPSVPPILLICKVGPAGSTATFKVTRSAPIGTLNHGEMVTVTAAVDTPTLDLCKTVWTGKSESDPPVNITIEEIVPEGMTLTRTYVETYCSGSQDHVPPVNPITVNVTYSCPVGVVFYNKKTETPPPPPPPPPPVGGQGCTPGYWKQKQHFDSWPAPYTPDMQFSAVFANAFPGKTLVQVLGQGGGGLIALGRHTVAALLSSGSVNYGMHTADVIAAFNEAYASGNYEPLHKKLEKLNEAGCPLN